MESNPFIELSLYSYYAKPRYFYDLDNKLETPFTKVLPIEVGVRLLQYLRATIPKDLTPYTFSKENPYIKLAKNYLVSKAVLGQPKNGVAQSGLLLGQSIGDIQSDYLGQIVSGANGYYSYYNENLGTYVPDPINERYQPKEFYNPPQDFFDPFTPIKDNFKEWEALNDLTTKTSFAEYEIKAIESYAVLVKKALNQLGVDYKIRAEKDSKFIVITGAVSSFALQSANPVGIGIGVLAAAVGYFAGKDAKNDKEVTQEQAQNLGATLDVSAKIYAKYEAFLKKNSAPKKTGRSADDDDDKRKNTKTGLVLSFLFVLFLFIRSKKKR